MVSLGGRTDRADTTPIYDIVVVETTNKKDPAMTTPDLTAEIILYLAKHSQDDRTFEATKLNKLLFAIDFNAYRAWGQPLTALTYIRQKHGPTPDPSVFIPLRDGLIVGKRAAMQAQTYYGHDQQRLVALAEPDLSALPEPARRLIDDVLDEFRGFNATQLSDWTHRLLPWLSTSDREDLPFYTVFTLEAQPIDPDTLTWANAMAQDIVRERDV